MSDVKTLKVLLAYHEQCKGLSLAETIEYLCMFIEESGIYGKYSSNRTFTEQLVKKVLFKERYGHDSIPVRMALLMCGGYPNFDSMTAKEREELDIFSKRWDDMFRD